KVGWRVWLGWMLASIASIALTLTATGAMVRAGSLNAAVVWAVFGSVIGASLGITQWLVLRHHIPQAYMWVVACAVGGAVISILGFAMGGPVGGPLGGAVIGASLGIPQWLVLRHRVSQAYVWVLASIMGFALGLSAGEAVGFATGEAVGWPIGGTIHGIVVGAITGTALVWLLRQPAPEG
ncbi:MAG: hypothetical protein ACRDH2_06695, partial [Anaerolineales bacterium]